jgi:hypothetical protein
MKLKFEVVTSQCEGQISVLNRQYEQRQIAIVLRRHMSSAAL